MATTSPGLERLGEQHLVLGRDAAHDADRLDPLHSLRLRHGGEVGPQDRLAADPELLGDGRAGDDVVAGHHAHADVGRRGLLHGLLRLVARRIEHADEARDLEVGDLRQQVAVGIEALGIEVADGRGHDTQAVALHAGDVLTAVGGSRSGPLEHGRRRALHVHAHDVVAGAVRLAVERRHQLVGRVEREGGQARPVPPGRLDVEPGLVREHEQGSLGRVADDLAGLEPRVVRDDVREDRLLDAVGRSRRVMHPALEP
jgi:hypothetical protein